MMVVLINEFQGLRFLRRMPENVVTKGKYIALSTPSSKLFSGLEAVGLKECHTDDRFRISADHFLNAYLKMMDVLAEHNGHNVFWPATDLASKNRFTSPLTELLSAFAHCLEAIHGHGKEERLLVIIRPPWPVVRALKDVARQFHWDFRILSWPWSRRLARWKGQIKTWLEFSKGCRGSILRIWEARRFFGRVFSKTIHGKSVYLIKSFVYRSSFAKDGHYQDPFFGELSGFLSKMLGAGTDVITVTAGFEKRAECLTRMRQTNGNPVLPLEVFLRWQDVFVGFFEILWSRFTRRLRIPEGISFLECKIDSLLKECLASGGWKISFYQYLHFAAGLRISKIYHLSSCALTFEGNPWERMFVAGLRRFHPELPVFGYQHSVVPQAAAGVFIRPNEEKYLHLPSVVLTTGEIPAMIMRHYGTLAPERIRPACALRYQYLYKIKNEKNENDPSRFVVLVALEGVWEVVSLLEYVLDQAPKCPEVSFRIRAHPVLPLSRLLNRLGREIPAGGNISVSLGGTVRRDVEDCQAVLYWGTAVALEALMMETPLIHFDRGDLLSYDPLFEFKDFKWIVRKDRDLQATLEEIHSLSKEQRAVLIEKGKEYIRSYFYEVNDKTMSRFLP